MSQYLAICQRNFSCFECGRAFKVPQKISPRKTPKTQTKIVSNRKNKPEKIPKIQVLTEISEIESPPEADTLDSTIHFDDLVVSKHPFIGLYYMSHII